MALTNSLLLLIFYYFPNEFVSGKHFPFSFLSSFVLLANQWGGMAPLCILAIPVTVVQPRFVNGGKARERSDRADGGCGRGETPPSHGREIFFSKFVYETGIFCTLDTIIRGSLFSWFILFVMKVSGKHFPFSLSFSLFFAF